MKDKGTETSLDYEHPQFSAVEVSLFTVQVRPDSQEHKHLIARMRGKQITHAIWLTFFEPLIVHAPRE